MIELGIFDLMLPAFAECLVLVGIHSYLGLHVLRRKVIFVDLALAQVAALGTTVGFLFGMAPDSIAALIFSILFTFFAAGLFSLARVRTEKVPQEAVIGLVYAVAAAFIILVVDRAPHGGEHIKEVMTGAILWVKWESIIFAAAVYSAVGLFHYIFRRQFLLISRNPEEAYRQGINVRFWDFLFYLSFGVVISISVRTAGVLLVFVFLVVPAIAANLITDKLKSQLVIGWAMGVVVTLLGLVLSYAADTPSGPTVVSFYGLTLLVASVAIYVWHSSAKKAALVRVTLGLAGVGLAAMFVILGGRALSASSLALSRVHAHQDQEASPAHQQHQEGRKAVEAPSDVDAILEALQGEGAAALATLVVPEARLLEAFDRCEDDSLRLAIAQYLSTKDRGKGAGLLLKLLRSSSFPFARVQILEAWTAMAGNAFGYEPHLTPEENQEALQRMESWAQGQKIAGTGGDLMKIKE